MGLIHSIRSDNYAYRLYDEAAIKRLEQILILRKLSINIKDIQRVFAASGSDVVLDVLGKKVTDIDEEVALLHELKEIVISFIRQIEDADFSNDSDIKLLYSKAKEIETQLTNHSSGHQSAEHPLPEHQSHMHRQPVRRLFEVTEKLEEKALSRLLFPDNILKKRLQNVYFILGHGPDVADELGRKYGVYVYHTCNNRWRYEQDADPQFQPGLFRNVPDVWALTPADMAQWESEMARDFTPMVIMDLIQLTANHEKIICENTIDIDSIVHYVTHAVRISNYATKGNSSEDPETRQRLEEIRSRDITDEEKDILIRNLHGMFGYDESGNRNPNREIPRETAQYGIKQIIWDDDSTVTQTADEIAEYFGFCKEE